MAGNSRHEGSATSIRQRPKAVPISSRHSGRIAYAWGPGRDRQTFFIVMVRLNRVSRKSVPHCFFRGTFPAREPKLPHALGFNFSAVLSRTTLRLPEKQKNHPEFRRLETVTVLLEDTVEKRRRVAIGRSTAIREQSRKRSMNFAKNTVNFQRFGGCDLNASSFRISQSKRLVVSSLML